jgi:hypothetical protein
VSRQRLGLFCIGSRARGRGSGHCADASSGQALDVLMTTDANRARSKQACVSGLDNLHSSHHEENACEHEESATWSTKTVQACQQEESASTKRVRACIVRHPGSIASTVAVAVAVAVNRNPTAPPRRSRAQPARDRPASRVSSGPRLPQTQAIPVGERRHPEPHMRRRQRSAAAAAAATRHGCVVNTCGAHGAGHSPSSSLSRLSHLSCGPRPCSACAYRLRGGHRGRDTV